MGGSLCNFLILVYSGVNNAFFLKTSRRLSVCMGCLVLGGVFGDLSGGGRRETALRFAHRGYSWYYTLDIYLLIIQNKINMFYPFYPFLSFYLFFQAEWGIQVYLKIFKNRQTKENSLSIYKFSVKMIFFPLFFRPISYPFTNLGLCPTQAHPSFLSLFLEK